MKRMLLRLFSIFAVLTLTSCSSILGEDKPEPVLLKLHITTSENINPSQMSEGNPVVVSLYQLSKIDTFDSAQSLDLFQQDTQILANGLIKKQTLASLLPNTDTTTELSILPGTKYLAVFAQFSEYPQAKTKAWVDISKIEDIEDIESIELSIEALSINMILTAQKSIWPWKNILEK